MREVASIGRSLIKKLTDSTNEHDVTRGIIILFSFSLLISVFASFFFISFACFSFIFVSVKNIFTTTVEIISWRISLYVTVDYLSYYETFSFFSPLSFSLSLSCLLARLYVRHNFSSSPRGRIVRFSRSCQSLDSSTFVVGFNVTAQPAEIYSRRFARRPLRESHYVIGLYSTCTRSPNILH